MISGTYRWPRRGLGDERRGVAAVGGQQPGVGKLGHLPVAVEPDNGRSARLALCGAMPSPLTKKTFWAAGAPTHRGSSAASPRSLKAWMTFPTVSVLVRGDQPADRRHRCARRGGQVDRRPTDRIGSRVLRARSGSAVALSDRSIGVLGQIQPSTHSEINQLPSRRIPHGASPSRPTFLVTALGHQDEVSA